VVAHGNVLRCIISYPCYLKEEEMLRLQVLSTLLSSHTRLLSAPCDPRSFQELWASSGLTAGQAATKVQASTQGI